MVGHVTKRGISPIHLQAITAARKGATVIISKVDATELNSMAKIYVVKAAASHPPIKRSCLSIDLKKVSGLVLRRIQITTSTINVRLIDR